jgi:hypothetical protein
MFYNIGARIMESFKNMVPQYALCIRDGEKLTLQAEQLTPGANAIILFTSVISEFFVIS